RRCAPARMTQLLDVKRKRDGRSSRAPTLAGAGQPQLSAKLVPRPVVEGAPREPHLLVFTLEGGELRMVAEADAAPAAVHRQATRDPRVVAQRLVPEAGGLERGAIAIGVRLDAVDEPVADPPR